MIGRELNFFDVDAPVGGSESRGSVRNECAAAVEVQLRIGVEVSQNESVSYQVSRELILRLGKTDGGARKNSSKESRSGRMRRKLLTMRCDAPLAAYSARSAFMGSTLLARCGRDADGRDSNSDR